MRKSYDSKFKSKVALEAIKSEFSITELSSRYKVHPNQISNWKKQFLENMDTVFSSSRKKTNEESEITRDDLLKEIGQLKVENVFLKKKYKQLFG
ncbi:transposase [bacterium]|jgi:transposase|nr:transposase [bacterium]